VRSCTCVRAQERTGVSGRTEECFLEGFTILHTSEQVEERREFPQGPF